MRIGVIIGRIGGIDGVAMETLKWIEVLEKMGHEVYIISGLYERKKLKKPNHYLFPILSFFSSEAEWEQRKAFFEPDDNPTALLEDIETSAVIISKKLEDWVQENKIDCLLSENASALPCHLSMGIGIKKFVEKATIPVVSHDHDFKWERGERYVSVHDEINQLVDNSFPLLLPHVKNAVINTYGVETFKERFNKDVLMVPNVMDFSKPNGEANKKRFFLKRMGVSKRDIVLLQTTRIVRRKAIETAILLVDKLEDKNLKLIITGSHLDDENNTYFNELVDLTHNLSLNDQVIFGCEKVNKPIDPLGAYGHGRASTYFSTYEGFGNTFVECLLSKIPIFVNNFKPVYMPDIGSKGFKTVMLENSQLTDGKVKDMADIIYDPTLAKEIGEYNFDLGRKHFSYEVLEDKLNQLFSFK